MSARGPGLPPRPWTQGTLARPPGRAGYISFMRPARDRSRDRPLVSGSIAERHGDRMVVVGGGGGCLDMRRDRPGGFQSVRSRERPWALAARIPGPGPAAADLGPEMLSHSWTE